MLFNGMTGAGSDSARDEVAAQGRGLGRQMRKPDPAPQPPPKQPSFDTGGDGTASYETIMNRPDSVLSRNGGLGGTSH